MNLDYITLEPHAAYPRRREAYVRMNCIKDLFNSCLGKIQTGGIGRINITLVPGAKEPKLVQLIDILHAEMPFDFDRFWQSSEVERKEQALEVIRYTIDRAAAAYGWNNAAFEPVYACMKQHNLDNRRFYGKPATSPDRKRQARLFCDFGSEKARVELVVTIKGDVERRLLVAETEPIENHFGRYVDGRLTWLDNHRILLAYGRAETLQFDTDGTSGETT